MQEAAALRRIFIAVNLPGKVKQEIHEKASAIVDGSATKIVEMENLHITLKFVGYVDERELQEIIGNVAKIELEKFEIVFGKTGTFNNRVLWVGLDKGAEKLSELAGNVQAAVEKGDNRFSPHVTFARNKSMPAGKVVEIIEKINSGKISNRMNVESFEVMESLLSSKGPEYRVVKSVSARKHT